MTGYDATQFVPATPVARTTLRNPTTGQLWTNVIMLLDSGSDVTLIPRISVDALNLPLVEGKGYELVGYDGHTGSSAIVNTTTPPIISHKP